MAEGLVPITECGPEELGTRLIDLVDDNVEFLEQRYFRGVIARYHNASQVSAVLMVEKAQALHEKGELKVFAVIDDNDEVQGMASIYPDLPLRIQRAPLPPNISQKIKLSEEQTEMGPNIAAWVDMQNFGLLSIAYEGLVTAVRDSDEIGKGSATWTIEPLRSPNHVHGAIKKAGMVAVENARFDDNEDSTHIPPKSTLYIVPNNKDS